MRFDTCILLLSGILLAFLRPARAAGEEVCPWLEISPSTAANGMGNLTSPYSEDPLAIWFLPGVSGIGPAASQATLVEYSGYSPRTDWVPEFVELGETFGSWAVRVRTPLNAALDAVSRKAPSLSRRSKVPMTLSLGVIHHRLSHSSWTEIFHDGNTVSLVRAKDDYATSFRMELGWQLKQWQFGAGLGYDHVTSNIGPITIASQNLDHVTGRISTFDWGLAAERKIIDRVPLQALPGSPLLLELGMAGSWARNFIGGELAYVPESSGDPMPRMDRLALASRFRVIHGGSGRTADLELLRLHVAAEHSATLIHKYLASVTINGIPDTDPGGYATSRESTDAPDTYAYAMDYRLFNKDIFSKDDATNRNWGAELSLLDMVTLRKGRHEDQAWNSHESTQGWGLDSNGLFRLIERVLPGSHDTPVLDWMLESVRVRYDHARWESDTPGNGTRFRQLTMAISF